MPIYAVIDTNVLVSAMLSKHNNSATARFGLMLEPAPSGETLPDMKDLPFYEVVMEKRKTDDSYLVTGNQKHFPKLSFIVSPKEMLNILDGKI